MKEDLSRLVEFSSSLNTQFQIFSTFFSTREEFPNLLELRRLPYVWEAFAHPRSTRGFFFRDSHLESHDLSALQPLDGSGRWRLPEHESFSALEPSWSASSFSGFISWRMEWFKKNRASYPPTKLPVEWLWSGKAASLVETLA
ncbi:hypothetical protein Nepgr_024166 [Nepenthes gracilis]|uniref:Uncharacterized protein n=1 Tax=Nepenthes gracilis TaxID=150966 RepID=A0AAD3T293_NEPGR|nr:hypothetical protein Nepgr_024166 [Nepenthes gracilis]